jgi:hypothetical protein
VGTKLWVLLTVCCSVDHPSLEQARSVVSGIYRDAGIDLEWGNDLTGATVNRTLTIVLTTRKKAPAGLRIDATGVAPTPGNGTRGTVAYVFIDAVTEFASNHRVPLAQVFGGAIAHEIGHLSLPPNAHRKDGIMRGSWHPSDFPPLSPGVPGFPADQAQLLRIRTQSR